MNLRNRAALVVTAVVLLLALPAAATTYGKEITVKETTKISDLLASPDKFVGKTVKVEGIVTDVCKKRGCWMALASDKEFETLRFKVEDGVIVLPVTAKGKKAVAVGILRKIELTKEEAVAHAKHMAEEQGKPFDAKSVTGPSAIYQLEGLGAVID